MFPVDSTLLEVVVSSTMADTLKMSVFVVKIVIPPDKKKERNTKRIYQEIRFSSFPFLHPFSSSCEA